MSGITVTRLVRNLRASRALQPSPVLPTARTCRRPDHLRDRRPRHVCQLTARADAEIHQRIVPLIAVYLGHVRVYVFR